LDCEWNCRENGRSQGNKLAECIESKTDGHCPKMTARLHQHQSSICKKFFCHFQKRFFFWCQIIFFPESINRTNRPTYSAIKTDVGIYTTVFFDFSKPVDWANSGASAFFLTAARIQYFICHI